MLSQTRRTTILELHAQGVGKREIARLLEISRGSVRQVLRSNTSAVPVLPRPEKAEPYRQQILELYDRCKGNLALPEGSGPSAGCRRGSRRHGF